MGSRPLLWLWKRLRTKGRNQGWIYGVQGILIQEHGDSGKPLNGWVVRTPKDDGSLSEEPGVRCTGEWTDGRRRGFQLTVCREEGCLTLLVYLIRTVSPHFSLLRSMWRYPLLSIWGNTLFPQRFLPPVPFPLRREEGRTTNDSHPDVLCR